MSDLIDLQHRLAALHLAQERHSLALRRRSEALKGNPSAMNALQRQRLSDDLALSEACEKLLGEALRIAISLARPGMRHG